MGRKVSDNTKQVVKLVESAKEVLGQGKNKVTKQAAAKFWLSLASTRRNPLTRRMELLSEEDLITIAMIKSAKKGNVMAYNSLMDRKYGKPKQEIERTENKTININAFSWGQLPEGKTLDITPHEEEE